MEPKLVYSGSIDYLIGRKVIAENGDEGVIEEIHTGSTYPIRVRFSNRRQGLSLFSYTKLGFSISYSCYITFVEQTPKSETSQAVTSLQESQMEKNTQNYLAIKVMGISYWIWFETSKVKEEDGNFEGKGGWGKEGGFTEITIPFSLIEGRIHSDALRYC